MVKQGEFGALLMEPGRTFYAPAFPLEEVFDPTGAGDAFAGGFMGYLARMGTLSDDSLRSAMVYGAAMGSYAVSHFGIRGFDHPDRPAAPRADLPRSDARRAGRAGAVSEGRGGGQYAAAGVDLAGAETAKERIGRLVAGTRTALSVGEVGAFGAWSVFRRECGIRCWC